MRNGRIGIVLALGLVVLGAVIYAPLAGAGPAPCQTKNVRTGIEYKGASSLASAITAANASDTIGVWGTCYGNFTAGRDLTLQGQGKNATLDGDKQGTVLSINAGTTTIRDLTITNGHTAGAGGGIYVVTSAVLVNVRVSGNSAGEKLFGGGIEADFGSSVRLINSEVSGNSAGSSGGIDMFRASVYLNHSTVSGNHATRDAGADPDGCGFGTTVYSCGGGIWNYQGTLILVDSTVSGNTAAYRGGGVVNYVRFVGGFPTTGLTVLSGSTSIRSNDASDAGGGIYANSDVHSSTYGVVAADGTATFLDPISGAALPAWTGSVSGNTDDQCSPTLTIGSTTCGA